MTRVACCLIVRDEESHILEWIAYHRTLGFDGFIIIDHRSVDRTRSLVAKAARYVPIELRSEYRNPPMLQERAYMDACRICAGVFDWVAFIDADEYIANTQSKTVHDLVNANPGLAGIALPWVLFGSSGHIEVPGGLMIESYTQRAMLSFDPNRHVKSLVRPELVRACLNAHFFVLDGEYGMADGSTVHWASPGMLDRAPVNTDWRVNHYFTRSRRNWERRLLRGQLGARLRSHAEFNVYDLNEEEDLSALSYRDGTVAILAKLKA